MANPRHNDLEDDISALMGATDEALWQRAGLFHHCRLLGSGYELIN
jgi:hypothetical protein